MLSKKSILLVESDVNIVEGSSVVLVEYIDMESVDDISSLICSVVIYVDKSCDAGTGIDLILRGEVRISAMDVISNELIVFICDVSSVDDELAGEVEVTGLVEDGINAGAIVVVSKKDKCVFSILVEDDDK